jgi:hypothetical protein
MDKYIGAGLLFTNQRVALAGYHPHKHTLSGVGGKRELSDASSLGTAFREGLEELFGFTEIPPSLMIVLLNEFSTPDHILFYVDYIQYVYSFHHLTRFLEIVKSYELKSPFYDIFPCTIEALLLKRTVKTGEITHLSLIPVLETSPAVDPFFQTDLKKLCIE